MTKAKGKLLAVVDMALRKSPDKADPLYAEFFEWPAGTEFEPPPHLKVELALARRIAVVAGDAKALEAALAFHAELAEAARRRTERVNDIDGVSAVQSAEARERARIEAEEQRKADEKRVADYQRSYERRRAAEDAERARAAEEQAAREAAQSEALNG